jgi:hypothetical protein
MRVAISRAVGWAAVPLGIAVFCLGASFWHGAVAASYKDRVDIPGFDELTVAVAFILTAAGLLAAAQKALVSIRVLSTSAFLLCLLPWLASGTSLLPVIPIAFAVALFILNPSSA